MSPPTRRQCAYARIVIEVPDAFAGATVHREGEAGRVWLKALPSIVDDLLERWSCRPDGPVTHGFVGIVLPVRHGDRPAVIKVSFPHPGNLHEPDAFTAWQGRGAVRLYERDDARFAMLLERAGRGTLAEITDAEEAVRTLGQLSRRLAVEAPAGLPRLSDMVAGWEAEMDGHPLSRRALDAVRELDQPETLVHGDLHDANVLAGDREPWLVIDPKGYAGDPAYDAFTVIHSPRLLFAPNPERWLDIFCAAAGVDRDRVRRWTLLRAIRSVSWDRRHGGPDWLVQAGERLVAALAG